MRRTLLLALAGASALVIPSASSLVGCSSDNGTPPVARPLGDTPGIDEHVQLDHLEGPVDVVRDQYGMVHIYATTVGDALRVEGYQVGRDRTAQLELIRRTAEGRTAEVFGAVSPGLVDDDISARTIGLTRVAQKMYDALDPGGDERKWLDAFADGVSQFYARIQSGDEQLPRAMVGLPQAIFTPWTGVDSLAVARYQSEALSFDAGSDISRQNFLDVLQSVFVGTSPDAELARRAGLERDLLRFAPLDPTTTLPGFPNDTSMTQSFVPPNKKVARSRLPEKLRSVHVPQALIDTTSGWLAAQKETEHYFGDLLTRGSNDWIVNADKTASGKSLLANDPHLSLSSPPVFWTVQLDVHAPPGGDSSKDMDIAGIAFPGIPGIILGMNEHVAWGATTTGYDVTDVYKEQLTSDGQNVIFNGQNVPIQKVHETIQVQGGAPVEYDVLEVPHHGPIIPDIVNHAVVPPDPAKGALSYRWTGLEVSDEVKAVIGFSYAKNVEDARTAIRSFEVGAQNWVFADDSGNVFYSSQSRIPKRDKRAYTWDPVTYKGTLPMFVLPGDGTAEWTGNLEEAYIPHVKNPSWGFVATANGDPVGVTLDNDPSNDKLPNGDPVYIGGDFDLGSRVGEITRRLKNLGHPATPEDMASIQADVHCPFGEMLAPKLIAAIDAAEAEKTTPGTHTDLTAVVADPRYAAANVAELRQWLDSWGKDSDYASESGVNPDDNKPLPGGTPEVTASQATLLFDAWLARMGMLTFDDEIAQMQGHASFEVPRALAYIWTAKPADLATLDQTTGESSLFDDMTTTNVTETSEQLAIESLLDAVDFLKSKLGPDRTEWRWGTLHTLRFDSLVSLWSTLSVPPVGDATFPNGFPRHGDLHTVDVGNWGSHPGTYDSLHFDYGSGPTQRFVASMDPAGPIAKNAQPGGNVWDNASPHFADEAERWRRNQNRPVYIMKADVIANAEERIAYDK